MVYIKWEREEGGEKTSGKSVECGRRGSKKLHASYFIKYDIIEKYLFTTNFLKFLHSFIYI